MKANEIRAALSQETIWMASEAIKRGCEAARRAKEESLKQRQLEKAGQPFNYMLRNAHYEGVRIAAEILWRLFNGYSAAVQSAICKVAKETDCYINLETYFDKFIEAYEVEYGAVSIRTAQ